MAGQKNEGNMKGLYDVDMEPEKALRLVKHGASLLLLDVPPGTCFGIDTKMFTVGPNFKGLKMIPPGPHFIYYNAVSRDGSESSPTIGFFIYPEPSEVIVRKWDPGEEHLINLADSSEEERFILAVKTLEFDRNLAPYDLKHYQDWKQISGYITKNVIERFEPIGGEISVMSETELIGNQPQTEAERRLMEQVTNAKKSQEQNAGSSGKHTSGNHRCFYTPIPHSMKQKGMTAEELTAVNIDKTQMLENLLSQRYAGQEDLLLGELQFAFVAFLMGQSLESFGQWKAIVCLMLCCVEAPLHTRTHLFTKFLAVIIFQLKHGLQSSATSHEQVSFVDESWFSEDNFLQILFKEFLNTIREAQPVDGDLLCQARKLQKVLETNLGWHMELESDINIYDNNEFAPVVVTDDMIS